MCYACCRCESEDPEAAASRRESERKAAFACAKAKAKADFLKRREVRARELRSIIAMHPSAVRRAPYLALVHPPASLLCHSLLPRASPLRRRCSPFGAPSEGTRAAQSASRCEPKPRRRSTVAAAPSVASYAPLVATLPWLFLGPRSRVSHRRPFARVPRVPKGVWRSHAADGERRGAKAYGDGVQVTQACI